MSSPCSRATGHRRRRLDRLAGATVALGLSMAAMPATGLASGWPSRADERMPFALLDLSEAGEALGRSELPLELLVAGSLASLSVGFALTLLVGALRKRRSVPAPEPLAAESSEDPIGARTTLPWPTQDADAFRSAAPPNAARSAMDEPAPTPYRPDDPGAPLDAELAEAWAAHEAAVEAAEAAESIAADTIHTGTAAAGIATANTADAADRYPMVEDIEPRPPAAAISPFEPALPTRNDVPFARSTLGTPEAPLVVELRDGRYPDADGRPVRSNLPLVVAIATVAVGLAFSAGAAVGASLGVGTGAAIGFAFAGGAGVAIGATVALLGGGRR